MLGNAMLQKRHVDIKTMNKHEHDSAVKRWAGLATTTLAKQIRYYLWLH